MLASGAGSQVLSFITSKWVVRLVARDDFGQATNAAIVALSAHAISRYGLGQYVVVKTRERKDLAFHASILYLVMGAMAFLGVSLFLGTIAKQTRSPDLARYMPGLLLAVSIDRIGTMPERILVRDQKFRPLALTRAMGELAYGLSSLLFAALGFGGMSVVYGNIVRATFRTAAFVRSAGVREWLTPARLEFAHFRNILAFSVPLSVSSALSLIAYRWDNLFVSKFHGPAAAADYNVAFNLADSPAGVITDQIGDVLLPSFAKSSQEERGAAFVRALDLLAVVCIPAVIGLGAVSQTFVEVFFKPQSIGVAPLLFGLSFAFALKPIAYITVPFLQGSDATGRVLFIAAVNVVALFAALYSFARHNLMYVCLAVTVAALVRIAVGLHLANQKSPIPWRAFFLGQLLPLLCSFLMVGGVLGLRRVWMGAGMGWPVARLVAEITVGAIVFILSHALLAPARTREFVGMIRNIRKG